MRLQDYTLRTFQHTTHLPRCVTMSGMGTYVHSETAHMPRPAAPCLTNHGLYEDDCSINRLELAYRKRAMSAAGRAYFSP